MNESLNILRAKSQMPSGTKPMKAYNLYICLQELQIISFSVVNMTEKFGLINCSKNYPNLKCQFLDFYNMIFNSLFLRESFPLIKDSCKERKKKYLIMIPLNKSFQSC